MFHLLATLTEFFDRARGRRVERQLTRYERVLFRIHEWDFVADRDERLKERSTDLAIRARRGVPLDKLLIEAFAVVRESARRVLDMRPFDVQMLAAIAMHQGNLAEMQTGEGKTLAAVLPAYLNALIGRGVHVLTFNDYLARRDAQWMGPLYRFLGLTVAAVQQGMSPAERRRAYACDVTYVTAKEAGFDYLRDHLCMARDDLVHSPFHYAIVDEADSILIDEARVPLVIAGSVEARRVDPYWAAELVRSLDAKRDFQTDEFARNVHFTDSGLDRLESQLRCGYLHAPENLELLTELSLALHAELLLRREVDYMVRDGQIDLVDEFTGRVAENRRWPDGLQAAVEAKEGVPLQPQGRIRGSITLQHFLRLYPKVCGMTATAQAAAEEFQEFYDLTVVVISPNRLSVRVDAEDAVFTHKEAKHAALVEEITRVQRMRRPVLVGTASVAESEHLATRLAEAGVRCRVLNARNDEQEATIIAQAALPGVVTISTNMAGRGTDIKLGGDPPREREPVVALGGLYVIGTNRHESRRIDDQLRGRAGRQGDPGQSRFFISLEDDLMERYGLRDLLPSHYRGLRQHQPLEDPAVTHAIARSQRFIEGQTFEIRRTLWRYASFVEEQRKIVHRRRQAILLDEVSPSLLANRAADRYEQLRILVGNQVLTQVEKQITLFHIDQVWAEYLVRVADIRENIHLVVLGGNYDPLDEFHKMVGREFADLLRKIDERIVRTFCSVEITRNGINLEKEGLTGPSSTWTYLISDNPFGDVLQRLLRGLKRSLVKDVSGA
ncbi:MAG: accessory Sec system translocase SecA2 [Thermoguttaceae bacterium]